MEIIPVGFLLLFDISRNFIKIPIEEEWTLKKSENIKGEFKKRTGIGIIVILIAVSFFFVPRDIFIFGIGILGGIGLSEIWQMSRNAPRARDILVAGIFAIYLCVSLFLFFVLRFTKDGLWWLVLGLSSAGIFDAFSYFGGKLWGKHRITPHISPHKTLEGLIAGFIGCGIIAFILGKMIFSFVLWKIAITPILLGCFAFLGDLFESFLKRRMGVKDSGTILKSHGGLLDRIDSVLGVVYGLYLLKFFLFQ
ncbi:CDP-archaeol synthase [bacterium]|nr:CDP-archaeol synthase [bacterium]